VSLSYPFLFPCPHAPPRLHSFPTRRSSDLVRAGHGRAHRHARLSARPPGTSEALAGPPGQGLHDVPPLGLEPRTCGLRVRCSAKDRKSTRLNSSHVKISYAVFCLKKKNIVL